MALFKNRASSAAVLADVRIPRSKFSYPYDHKTTCNAGDLIPVFYEEIIPGATRSLDPSELVRSLTPIAPVMDNAYCDLDFFFVPNRLTWSDWQYFMGENPDAPWYNDTVYSVPMVPAGIELLKNTDPGPSEPNPLGFDYSLWDYFGLPTADPNVGSANYSAAPVSLFLFRDYGFIWSEFYRNENVQDPLLIQKGQYVPEVVYGAVPPKTSDGLPYAYPLKSCRLHDRFSDALPSPQKGPDVIIPGLGSDLPVSTGDRHQNGISAGANPLTWSNATQGVAVNTSGAIALNTSGNTGYTAGTSGNVQIVPDNLIVDSSALSGATIAALRTAFQIQKILERDSYGTRYTEVLRNHYGVISPDARLQRPEYLGGIRVSLSMQQVAQTSGTTDESPLGTTGAFSKTTHSEFAFTKTFLEHGFVIGLLTVRTDRSYQQGIARMWTRSSRFDYYFPELALVSNTPIYQYELFGYAENDEQFDPQTTPIFGYQEAWDEYRRHPNIITGGFRSAATDSLDIWHYADYYSTAPTLSPAWMRESLTNVNRTLAVQANEYTHNQFLVDLYFGGYSILPMPATSQPGLVDHF